MSGFIQVNDSKIISVSPQRLGDTDIEVSDAALNQFYTNELNLSDFCVIDNKIEGRDFSIGGTLDSFKSLEVVEDYSLELKALNILLSVNIGEIAFILPYGYTELFKAASFIFKIDDQPLTIKLNQFEENIFILNADLTSSHTYSISQNIGRVNLVRKLKNVRVAKPREEHLFNDITKKTSSNIVHVSRQGGQVYLPSYLRGKIAYYVNAEDRNEIVDIVKTQTYMTEIPNTIILIEDYELILY